MAFSVKSGMTNLTRVSTTLGYYIGAWGEEVQIINSSGTFVGGITPTSLKLADGSAAAPSLSFLNDTDTGIYSGGGGSLNFSANTINAANITSQGILIRSGSAALPSISFITDNDTGFFLSAANTIGVATAGSLVGSVNGNGLWTVGAASGTQDHAVNGTFNALSSKTSQASWRFRNLQASNPAANAVLLVGTADGTGGSPFINYNIGGGTQNWSSGINNGSSDRFEIAASSGLGTNSYFTISTGGLVTLGASSGTQRHVINGGAATAGAVSLTLTNGPTGTSGNPAVWLQLTINGTSVVIPAWSGA